MKAVKSIRNAKSGNVDTASLPVVNNANDDARALNRSWGLAKDHIIATARDIVSNLSLLPKSRRVHYERRWKTLVDRLATKEYTDPDVVSKGLVTLLRDIKVVLICARRYIANNRARLARMIVAWEKAYDAATCGCSGIEETPLKHVRFHVEFETEQPTL